MHTEEVILRAKGGDMDAFEQIVRLYEKKIYNIAYKYVLNEADALDMTQEAFLRVWRGLPGFEMNSGFLTWVYRITANACIDFLRKEKRNKNYSLVFLDDDDTGSELDLPDERYEPEAVAEKREEMEQIESALGELETEYRTVLMMRELGGLTYTEIAQTLSIKEGTVKSRISRAREKMRRKLIACGNFSTWDSSNRQEERIGEGGAHD